MAENIINCYDLDFKQDIPAKIELIRSTNENLKTSNHNFKIILLSIGLGVVIWFTIRNSKPRTDEKEKH